MLDSTHPIPGMQHFFLHRRSETSSHVACWNGCGKLTIFTFTDVKTRSCESRLYREKHSVPTFMFRHK